MYAAIDGLVDKLDRQIIKHKEKLKSSAVTRSEAPTVPLEPQTARHRIDPPPTSARHAGRPTDEYGL